MSTIFNNFHNWQTPAPKQRQFTATIYQRLPLKSAMPLSPKGKIGWDFPFAACTPKLSLKRS